MGQGGSKEREPEEIQFSGVRITPELVAKLSGIPVIPQRQPRSGGGEMMAVRPPDQAERDAAAMINRSELLQRALERSTRVGDLLLAREDEELEQINALAEEMINKEYSAPSRARPCQGEASACLQCYEANPENPTACAETVQAYSTCARQAASTLLRAQA